MYRKYFAAFFAALTLTLCGCAAAAPSPVATLPDLSESNPVVTDIPEETESDTSLADLLTAIQENVTPGSAGASLRAVPYAVNLLQWGMETGLDAEKIKAETAAYLLPLGNDDQIEFSRKLELTYDMVLELLGTTAADVLSSAGMTDTPVTWDINALNAINPILEAVGLEYKEPWKVSFEESLLENYNCVPSRYEHLEGSIYQVYVIIDGKEVPYVAVDSETGDYHG